MKLATLCYVRSDGSTLMLMRGAKPGDIHAGKYNGLGGKLEPGEAPETAVIREVREESGLEIRNPQLHGILSFPRFKDGEDWHVFLYLASEFSGELQSGEEGELAWVANEKLLSLPLWEGDYLFLPPVFEGNFVIGTFHYENKKLIHKAFRVHEGGLGKKLLCA